MLLLAGLDDTVDLIRTKLVKFALFVVEAWKLISLLTGLDILFPEPLGIASTSG